MLSIKVTDGNGNSKRMKILISVFVVWFAVIFIRLVELQVIRHGYYKTEVLEQNRNKITVNPKRGTIYDRNGKILARSLPVQSVFFSPFKNEAYEQQAEKIGKLEKILSLSNKELSRIQARLRKKESFTWIKRKIPDELAKEVDRLGIKGVFLEKENLRFYPQGALAAHVLGGVDIDDRGQAGIEIQYESVLRGEPGERLILRDANRKKYHIETLREAEAGKDLYLTIDETIQYIAEQELEKAARAVDAEWGTVIISRPATGEILALANNPGYDANDYPPPPEAARNLGIQNIFEPGSTFKIITASAARERTRIGFSEVFDCRKGAIAVGRSLVDDHKLLGTLTFSEVFVQSSNVGTIMVGKRVGDQGLFETIKDFRIGFRTGIDLPAEESGICRPLSSWTVYSLPHIAIGYEISVTALQMLQAMNIIANRGLLIRPKITLNGPALSKAGANGSSGAARVISEKTASELIERIFTEVVEKGTGDAAKIQGFSIAGKTGTAQKYDPAIGGYSTAKHLASFVGFVPADEPLISMVVVIDEPKGLLQYGGQVAAPLFREIALRVLRYLRMPPRLEPAAPLTTVKLEKASRT